jgi:preprotein translocase subunit SecY
LFLVVKSSEDTLILSGYEWLFGQFESGNSIVFDIAVGILVSILFYYIVVYIPESSRKIRIKRSFIYQYKEFRKRLI